jgi:hypothetical protein
MDGRTKIDHKSSPCHFLTDELKRWRQMHGRSLDVRQIVITKLKQEGHDGPEIAHLNIKTLHDKEQVIL